MKIKTINKEMENLVETMCRFCLGSETCENYDLIDKHARDTLGIVLPQWNLDEGRQLICKDCSTKLFAAFDFKGICINTEDCIFPYVNSEKGESLDLREIYLNETDSKLSISEIQNVCRLCMQLIFGEFISLEQLDVNMLDIYIPEINFSSTKNPVICEACYEAFKTHGGFLMICLENKKKVKFVNGIRDLKTEVDTKTEEVDLKMEEIDTKACYEAFNSHSVILKIYLEHGIKIKCVNDGISHLKTEEITLKTEENNKRDLEETAHENNKIKCEASEPSTEKECNLEVGSQETFQPQQLQHKTDINPRDMSNSKNEDVRRVRTFNCDKCSFQTTYPFHLKRHQLLHEDPSLAQMYKCDECSYKTRCKSHVARHKLVHTDPSQIQMFECDECSFKTRFKSNLLSHKVRHRDPSEIEMQKCDECSYQTKRKLDLRKHKLKHRDPSERQTYKCETCARSFKQKSYVQKHMMTACGRKSGKAKCDGATRKRKQIRDDHKINSRDILLLDLRNVYGFLKYPERSENN